MQNYRKTHSMFVCTPTSHMADLSDLEAVIKRFKEVGGKLPPTIEAALEVAKTGRNIEDSMNAACNGLFEFYINAEKACAEKVGYTSFADVENGDWQKKEAFDLCLLPTISKWQVHSINYTINPLIESSAVRVFIRETKEQVFRIVQKYLKKQVIDRSKGASNPPPP